MALNTATVNNVLSSTPGSTSPTNAKNDAASQQDRFLKLLVAQMNNQDPMNPMDNAQLTSQTAQISTVSGIEQLNETVKAMTSQFAATQMLQGATLIGHDVMTAGNRLPVQAGKAEGGFDLGGPADAVSVQVRTPGGQLLQTLDLGALPAGRKTFSWDAGSYNGASPTFVVTASNAGKAVSSSSVYRDTVAGVTSNGGTLTLALKGGSSVQFNQIQSVL
ncbi:MAG: flagellar hook assembly protein FlgD [Rhodoferax sp.]|nr:flagellar hook assembly protein FlgD [Rhodoferax sp.]